MEDLDPTTKLCIRTAEVGNINLKINFQIC